MTICNKKKKAFQYDNAEECDIAWQIAKKDEVQFAYERGLVQMISREFLHTSISHQHKHVISSKQYEPLIIAVYSKCARQSKR